MKQECVSSESIVDIYLVIDNIYIYIFKTCSYIILSVSIPAVGDNGSGMAAMLEAAKMVAESSCPRLNSIIFVAFDWEEFVSAICATPIVYRPIMYSPMMYEPINWNVCTGYAPLNNPDFNQGTWSSIKFILCQ